MPAGKVDIENKQNKQENIKKKMKKAQNTQQLKRPTRTESKSFANKIAAVAKRFSAKKVFLKISQN